MTELNKNCDDIRYLGMELDFRYLRVIIRMTVIITLMTVGFADDTNLLAYARDTKTVCEMLERGYKVYEEWVKERGMEFNLSKSELIYFTRIRRIRINILNILGKGNPGLILAESTRFLGVWLDRKLSFTKY